MVVYSGGEPLRYPDLEEALSAARTGGTPATIFTTGIADKRTRLPVLVERWRELKSSGLTAARFSVYSGPSNREFHNQVVQTRPAIGDAFGANEQAIKEFVQLDMGVGILPRWLVAEEIKQGLLVSLPLGRRRLKRRWGVLYSKKRKLSLADNLFINISRSVFRSLVQSSEA